jgi:hypothetical protein
LLAALSWRQPLGEGPLRATSGHSLTVGMGRCIGILRRILRS